jgi:NAD(P)-dependent dehydrogenase (short-subunit alcohol dehydrogenase family)
VSGRLEGRVAVVTGGGNGIGRACCERFAEEGADVVVADLLDDAGGETVQLVEKAGRSGEYVHLDAASPEGNTELVRQAVDRFGKVDVLVTAAGISHAEYRSGDRTRDQEMLTRAIETRAEPARRLLDLELEQWQKVLDVNLTGTFLAVQANAR